MINAKTELLEKLKEINKSEKDIKFIAIVVNKWDELKRIITNIQDLDFEYDCGYGGQELFGYVLFNDDTWLERGEYDGAEWWEYKKLPTIEELKMYLEHGEY